MGITESEFDSWRHRVEAYLSDLQLPTDLLQEWDETQDIGTYIFRPNRYGNYTREFSHPLEPYENRLRAFMTFLRKIEAYVSLSGKDDRPQRPRPPNVRILLLAANPTTTTRLDREEEVRVLERELLGVRFRSDISLRIGHAARPDDLIRLLREAQPTIVHFSGHGSGEGIILRSETGSVPVSGQVLSRLFRARGVDLIVLNACFSQNQAVHLKDVVRAVVGTTDVVADEAALRFTVAFYRTLGNGHSLKEAFLDGGDAVAVRKLEDVYLAYGNVDQPLCGIESA